jgi:intein/homing endonuclease
MAKNWEGYKNLCALSQASWTEGLYIDPRIDFDLLSKHSAGLICNSACLSSVVNANLLHDRYDEAKKAVALFKDIFADDFHLEVMYHGIEAEGMIIPDIIKLSKEMSVKVIATNDCFVAGTMISTENGVIPIENISKGDYVITHKNRLGEVEFVNKRKVNKTFLVKTVLGTSAFETTAEHPILTVQRIGNTKFTQPNWKKCEDLTNNDYLLIHKKLHEDHVYKQKSEQKTIDIPEIIGDKYNSDIYGNYYITHQGFGGRDGKVKIPTTLKVCDELLFILGRYVAEGYCDCSSHQIGFAANCNEKHIQDRIEKYFAKFGVTSYRPEKNNDCKLVFTSKIFKALFTALCGIGAENKHLPSIGAVSYFAFSKSQMLKILAAYIEGDGHIAPKEGRASVICASTSRTLAYQISDVLQSFGFVSLPTVRNFAKTKHKNPKANPQKWLPLYVLHMSEIDIFDFLKMMGISKNKTRSTSVSRRKFIEIDDYFAIKVRNVTEFNEEKLVYNLQIAQDESFLANFYVVHNCHYCKKEHGSSQEILMCMSTSRCINDPKRLHFPYHEFYLKSAPEMAVIFGANPEFLTNTKLIADKVDAKDIFNNMTSGMRLPRYKIPPEFASPIDYVRHLANEGMKKLGWDKSPAHQERMQRELDDIRVAWENNKYDFATYFLISA